MREINVDEKVVTALKQFRGNVRIYENLEQSKLALVIIDMQNAFVSAGGPIEVPKSREIIPNINRIAGKCREKNIPVIWIKSIYNSDWSDAGLLPKYFLRNLKGPSPLSRGNSWSEITEGLDVKEDDYIVDKCRFSALVQGSSKLERLLKTLDRDTIIITGTKTEICCESTARDAMQLDFKVVFIKDATATVLEEDHQAALNVIIQRFGDVLSTDEIVRELATM